MSPLETVFKYSTRIEFLLAEKTLASGSGLHEKAMSVEHLLPREVLFCCRYVARVRNKFAHTPDYEHPDMAKFVAQATKVTAFLEQMTGVPRAAQPPIRNSKAPVARPSFTPIQITPRPPPPPSLQQQLTKWLFQPLGLLAAASIGLLICAIGFGFGEIKGLLIALVLATVSVTAVYRVVWGIFELLFEQVTWLLLSAYRVLHRNKVKSAIIAFAATGLLLLNRTAPLDQIPNEGQKRMAKPLNSNERSSTKQGHPLAAPVK